MSEALPMVEKFRFRFSSMSIQGAAPVVMSYPPPRRAGDAPILVFQGEKYYMISASSFRGKIRRWVFKNIVSKHRKINPFVRFSSADLRAMILGGVKGSGRSDYLSPEQVAQVRLRRPDYEIFGCNDPVFLSGCLAAGMTLSVDPVLSDRTDPEATIPIVRRTMLTDPVIQGIDLTDAGSMEELRELNQQRSEMTTAITKLERLERKKRTTGENRDYEQMLATLTGIAGRPITKTQEAKDFLAAMRETMKAEGHSDVSEANFQVAVPIPGGTQMHQRLYLNQISLRGAGLFMAGWHDAYCFDPAIGGMVARGAGGYLTSIYKVERQIGYDWTHDCTIKVEPDVGISFSDATASVLQQSVEEWREVDISEYDFTFNALKTFIGEK